MQERLPWYSGITRYQWTVLALASAGRPATADEPKTETKPASKPNILFLLSDDHSYPYLGCYGNPDVQTPNLDRLASEGLRCDRMFVSCPQCVPSRAAHRSSRNAQSGLRVSGAT